MLSVFIAESGALNAVIVFTMLVSVYCCVKYSTCGNLFFQSLGPPGSPYLSVGVSAGSALPEIWLLPQTLLAAYVSDLH